MTLTSRAPLSAYTSAGPLVLLNPLFPLLTLHGAYQSPIGPPLDLNLATWALFGFCHFCDAQSVNGTLPVLFLFHTFVFFAVCELFVVW